MFPEWTWIVGLLIGATFGSFLNVVIYRMPLGMSLSEPKHSFCPNCKTRLTVLDLFPLFSWLFSGGKCRHCKVAVPSRYFWVELITGGLWAVIWYQNLVLGWDVPRALCYFAMVSALVAATFIDLRWFIIPDQINAFLLVVGLAYNGWLIYTGSPQAWLWGMPVAVAGAIVGTLAIWSITFFGRLFLGKNAMGHGDIKLLRGIGACVFPFGAGVTVALAVVLGAVLGVLQIIASRRAQEEEPEDEAEPYEDVPESLGSIVKSGVGYLLAFDVIGLFVPKFYMSWFGEDPYSTEDVDSDWEPSSTTIPFGPYLAAGAILFATAEGPIRQAIQAYLQTMGLE